MTSYARNLSWITMEPISTYRLLRQSALRRHRSGGGAQRDQPIECGTGLGRRVGKLTPAGLSCQPVRVSRPVFVSMENRAITVLSGAA